MDYAIGALITLTIVVIVNRLIVHEIKDHREHNTGQIRYSQSHVYSLIAPFLDTDQFSPSRPKTQTDAYYEKTYLKILVFEGFAYWIKNNQLYRALMEHGQINHETTEEVDTMVMNDVQLQKTIMIVEMLKEGSTDDRGSAGKQ